MLNESDLIALAITLRLALISTLILLLLGTPLAWWLARTRWRFKFLLEAVIALPLVLPPTVLGFYLLVALGPNGPVGGLMRVHLPPLASVRWRWPPRCGPRRWTVFFPLQYRWPVRDSSPQPCLVLHTRSVNSVLY